MGGVMAKTMYQRIMRAARRSAALHLSSSEVLALCQIPIIRQLAANDDAAEIAVQCSICLHRPIVPEGWHCASHEEPPVGRCGDWKGAE